MDVAGADVVHMLEEDDPLDVVVVVVDFLHHIVAWIDNKLPTL